MTLAPAPAGAAGPGRAPASAAETGTEASLDNLTRQDTMQLLLQGVVLDQAAYGELEGLMEQQFDAALRHQRARLEQLADAIMVLVEAMELRRRQRLACATRLLGEQPSMAQVFQLLKPEPRARLEQDWQRLEQRVLECKRLGKRNGDFLADQYTIMQRVLHGEDQTYEPA